MSRFYSLEQAPLNLRSSARAIAAANNGLLFDIGDMSTLYQDAAGTIPVTAVEQPVGLILDKSQGLMLGSELVVNGTFNTDVSGWVTSAAYLATITANNGACSFTSVNPSARIRPGGISTTIGNVYKVSIDILSLSTTVTVLASTESSQGISVTSVGEKTVSTAGTYSFMFKATTATTYLWVINNGAIASVVTIDNVSVKEIYGNHATQPVTASRPTLSARKNVLLATETLATQSVTTIAAQYTLSFTGTGSVTLSGAATGTLTGTGAANRVSLTVTPTARTLTLTVSGSVTKAQLELGAVAEPYQRVTTATDYDTDERYFPKYLKFDGIDDYLNLPYMRLYAVGACSVIAGVALHKSATQYVLVCESSGGPGTAIYYIGRQSANSGQFDALIRDDASNILLDSSGLTGLSNSQKRVVSLVDTGSVLAGYNNSALMFNPNYVRSGSLTLSATLIGATATSSVFNYASMKLYGLIITKSALTNAQRVRCERFLAQKSGVML